MKIESAIRVEVTAEPIIPGRSGSNERGPWQIPAKQRCAIWQGNDPFPIVVEIVVPDAGPYKPGIYLLGGKPFKVGAVGNRTVIQFDDRAAELVPVDAAALKAAA